MAVYGVATRTNCITGREYVPRGSSFWVRLDARLSTANALQAARDHFRGREPDAVHIIVARGELNRGNPLQVLASYPPAPAAQLSPLVND